jgi:hypothetical protein
MRGKGLLPHCHLKELCPIRPNIPQYKTASAQSMHLMTSSMVLPMSLIWKLIIILAGYSICPV